MAETKFSIQDTAFSAYMHDRENDFANIISVASVPRPYDILFVSSKSPFSWFLEDIKKQAHPLLFVDENIKDKLSLNIRELPILSFKACEENKQIDFALQLCDFLKANNANRGSMLYVAGGGITQDIGAFACAVYKRGIPWTFIPTTLLAQTDSCLGGKCALNYAGTKNMLALFSAPRKIFIDTTFLKTLNSLDIMSGLGETFRLLITGGESSLKVFEENIDGALSGSPEAMLCLINSALSVKKAVVEKDEFETDLRRSMNYGHSLGHAMEALSNYKIPHGLSIAMGILIENQISVNRGILPIKHAQRITEASRKIIPLKEWDILKSLDVESLLPLLSGDKKAEGKNLKLATLRKIGELIFIDLPLDNSGLDEVSAAINDVLKVI